MCDQSKRKAAFPVANKGLTHLIGSEFQMFCDSPGGGGIKAGSLVLAPVRDDLYIYWYSCIERLWLGDKTSEGL